MGCFLPEHMHFEEEGRRVVLYPSCAVGVSAYERGVAIVLNHPRGMSHVSPALVLDEKATARLILELQAALRQLSLLPVTPYTPLD